MKRIIIIGNSGSGKTHLAQRLCTHFDYQLIHMNVLFWEPDRFGVKRPQEIVYAEIAALARKKTWVVEGVFGELAQEFSPKADTLIWLDLDWGSCFKNLLLRRSENSNQPVKQSDEEMYAKLLKWASEYWRRSGPSSYQGHRFVFEQFNGDKICLNSRKSVDDFVESIIDA